MCRTTDIYFASCNHWGARRVESSCIGADYHGLGSGCWNTTLVGTTRLNEFCPTCIKFSGPPPDHPSQLRPHSPEAATNEGSRSSIKSASPGESSAPRGSVSGSEHGSEASHTCSELSIDVAEVEEVQEGVASEGAFGTRFGGWVNYTASSKKNEEGSPWQTGWKSGVAEGEEGFGKRFGGWIHLNASNFERQRGEIFAQRKHSVRV